MNGFSGPGQGIADYYRQHDVPLFVIEQGHIRRGEYYQLGFERLNWLPDAADSKRREALGIEKPKNASANDGYVLFLGQKPGDAQSFGEDVTQYLSDKALSLGNNRTLAWRKHPLDTSGKHLKFWGYHGDSVPLDVSLHAAHSVVTFNSNAGLKAILAGVPTFCDPRAIYAGACKTDVSEIEEEYSIPRADWEDTLNRICYAQWNVDELGSGEAWAYIKEQSGVANERTTVSI